MINLYYKLVFLAFWSLPLHIWQLFCDLMKTLANMYELLMKPMPRNIFTFGEFRKLRKHYAKERLIFFFCFVHFFLHADLP